MSDLNRPVEDATESGARRLSAPGRLTDASGMGTPWGRTDWLILLLVVALAGALRFYQLGVTPPGFQFDEAYNAIDAVQVLEGNRPLFLPANGGREVLFTYFQAVLIRVLGESVWSFRLASALWGTAGVAAAFVLFRTLLRRESRLIATCGAVALAISYWHIHYSHFGIRVITMPVLFSALFGVYWLATQATAPRRAISLYLLAGVLLGLSVYSNPTGRLAPLVLIAHTVLLLWWRPGARKFAWSGPVGGLLLAGVAAFVVFLPLGITFLQHPEFFLGHASEVSVFAERVSGESGPIRMLLSNALHVAGMFSFYGDLEWTHGIAGRPVLDWVISIPFYLGVLVWAARLVGRRRHADEDYEALWLLLFWVVVMLAPSIFSDAAPNTSRTLPSLPASYLPLAFGLAWLVWLPQHPEGAPVRSLWPRRWMGFALAGLVLLVSGAITFRDYFVRYPAMREVYTAYDVDKLDALTILGERAADSAVFLSPLWGNHSTVRYLRERYAIRVLDPLQAVVLPPGRAAVYALTGEEGVHAEALAAQWPGRTVEVIDDRYGKPLLHVVTVPADETDAMEEWPPGRAPAEVLEVRFDDAPTLMGIQQAAGGDLLLFWRADAPTYRNLTAFVHFTDADGKRVAQVDRVPGNGSFQTPYWLPGERVVDRALPVYSDPCAAGVPLRAMVGWYEWAADNARRPLSNAPGDQVLAGEVTLPVRPYFVARAQNEDDAALLPAPAVALDIPMGEATLIGYTLHEGPLRAGTEMAVELFVRVDEAVAEGVASIPASLSLATGGSELPLADATFTPVAPLRGGDEACRRVRARLPAESAGAWMLTLKTPAGAFPLGAVQVDAQGVQTMPEIEQPVDARFGGTMTLLGTEVAQPEGASGERVLPVTLFWRVENPPQWPVVGFVHLLGNDGSVIAQSDAPPGGLPPSRHAAGDVIVDRRSIMLPEVLPPAPYRLVAGLYDALTFERLPGVDGSGAPLPDNVVLIESLAALK